MPEPTWNVQRCWWWGAMRASSPLLDEDAEAVAEALVGEDVAAIVSSPLPGNRRRQVSWRIGIERGASTTAHQPAAVGCPGVHQGRDRRTMVLGGPMAERGALELDSRETLPVLTPGSRRCELACTSAASGAALAPTEIPAERAWVACALRTWTRRLLARRGRQRLRRNGARP